MKDKLREFLKTGTRKTVMRGESGRYPNGEGWGHSWNEEVVEFNAKKLDAALIDAEGDGGAVTCQDALIYAGDQYTDKYKDDDRQDIKTDVLNAFYQGANWMRKTNPARSGVVSDEDVDAIGFALIKAGWRPPLGKGETSMRAALESYERNRK